MSNLGRCQIPPVDSEFKGVGFTKSGLCNVPHGQEWHSHGWIALTNEAKLSWPHWRLISAQAQAMPTTLASSCLDVKMFRLLLPPRWSGALPLLLTVGWGFTPFYFIFFVMLMGVWFGSIGFYKSMESDMLCCRGHSNLTPPSREEISIEAHHFQRALQVVQHSYSGDQGNRIPPFL